MACVQNVLESGLFDPDKKLKNYTEEERNLLLYGAKTPDGEQVNKKIEGIYHYLKRTLLSRDTSDVRESAVKKLEKIIIQKECPCCHGKRLNPRTLACKINGLNIYDMCELEFSKLRDCLLEVKDPRAATMIDSLVQSLTRMIDIGLPYLSMNRESSTLSGGEAQRLKLVRYMGSSLTGMTYIFDEPSTGMHPRDVHRMTKLLKSLRDKGNTVLVVEHDKDIISIADEIIDMGPAAGRDGGQVLFQGSYEQLLLTDTLTGVAMREEIPVKMKPRIPTTFLPIQHASIHNLKDVSVDIPLNVPILNMSAEEALRFFAGEKKITKYLHAMVEVGLGYLSLGQPTSTLSGGEIVFTGTPKDMLERGDTITTRYLRKSIKNVL